jgi:hypothetical protein
MSFEYVLPILAIVVTALGFVLSLVWSYILAASAKVPAQGDQPHKIKYGGLEIQTDRVVMLLTVCVLAMVLPISLTVWLTARGLPAHVLVIATVESSPGNFVAEGVASVVRVMPGGGNDVVECQPQKLSNGEFSCQFVVNNLADVFELVVTRPNGGTKKIQIRPTEQHAIVAFPEPK